MTRKIFIRLMGIFILLLIFHAVSMEYLFHHMDGQPAEAVLKLFRSEAIWSDLIALAIALLAVAWISGSVSRRMQRLVRIMRSLADGDFHVRVNSESRDEFASVEKAFDQAATHLCENFARIEGRREEFVAMLDAMQEAVVAVSAQGIVLWSNAVMQRIAGIHVRAGLPLAYSVRDPEVLACIASVLERHEICNGSARTLVPGCIYEINATPMPSGGAIIVLHNVTSLEAAEKARRDFVANVSHELRTPLTSIHGYVETLVEDPSTNAETTREFLGIVLKNASRMSRLTEDLLALASIEGPDYKPALKSICANALLGDAKNFLNGLAVDSVVRLELGDAPDTAVLADTDAMNQVFGNLIENALKYAKSGGRVLIGARALENEVEFSVQDFGPGIASEHVERIFERFYRVDKARSRESGGTGLGLAIVKHIILAHNGRIWAESELGSGVTFRFTLPIAPQTV